MCPKVQEQNTNILPKSRAYQVQVDLLRACNDEKTAYELEHKVWDAVADETASAVRYGFKGACFVQHFSLLIFNASHLVKVSYFYFPTLSKSIDALFFFNGYKDLYRASMLLF
jgi:hypothetical protein